MAELPSGTVTFLFTDLEGSTRLWEELPEAMSEALARHDDILRDAVEAHDGVVLSRMGDGIAAVFASAPHAVAAALDVQRRMAVEPWADTGPLRARMGLHTDEGRMRAPGEYMNQPLNRCARLMATAYGGQMLLSDATAAVTRGRLPEGVALVDLGEHRLRDLAEPMRVFQVTHPDLASHFPPIRSLDALPGNLPAQLTSFVGREEELAGIAKALDEWRMVTLTGVGGVGKTRLAVQVAAEVLLRFRDGAWLCELAAAADDTTMAQLVAAELGVAQRPGMSLAVSISDYLRVKELLLVLDNCEHLLGPVSGLAARILRQCPGVRILATSREGLAVGGEHVWPLPSLPLPDPTGVIAATATNDAVVLFVDRAQATRATFVLDESNATAICEICRRLDGIPLAIELAATRVVSMSPSEISGLLDERFRLLTGGRRSAVERQQTLRATVDWSYSLLGERERAVFDRLGVFAGTFDARAAQAVVTGDGVEAWDVLDALTELVTKSMILAEETADGTTRHQMLETLAQYARERLDEDGDVDGWRRRHAQYFAEWAEEAGPGLEGPDELAWRTRENAELDNLRAAVTWTLDRDDPNDTGLAVRIIGALANEATNNPTAGIGAWAERALPHADITSPQLRYAVTAAAAIHQANLGNYQHAQELAQQAIGDGVPNGAPAASVAYATLSMRSLLPLGEPERALAIALDAARLLDRDYPGSVHAAAGHRAAAMIATYAGDQLTARAEAEVALRQARETANPTALAASLMAYGWTLIADDPAAALAALEQSLALSRQGASLNSFGTALRLAAGARFLTGDLPHAVRDLREAIERSHQASTRFSFYNCILWGIEILNGLDHLEQSAVFDGIASTTGLTPETRTGAVWAHQYVTIARARAALGPEPYDQAFRTGAQMTYDQAVEHSLQVLDDVVNETSDTHTT
jgi:predicted ATPase/class 3 adenylate cyclase